MAVIEGYSDTQQYAYPADVLIATHRGPVSLSRTERGHIITGPPAGGLAPSLARALQGTNVTWLACAMGDLERTIALRDGERELIPGIDIRYLPLDEHVVEEAYQTIANETLWFVLHGMADLVGVKIDDRWWRAFRSYRAYNEAFARAIAREATPGATIMVNDYHLQLVGTFLRRERPDLRTVHFSHTPFCTPESLAVLPDKAARELLEGMVAFGACGFHTPRWAANFSSCVEAYGLRAPHVFCCPLGVDAEALEVESNRPSVMRHVRENRERFAGKNLVFRNDRLEPTKNIVRGLKAYRWLLERDFDLCRQTVFYSRSYLSRADLPFYRAYRHEIEHNVSEINLRFAKEGYQPIVMEIDNDYDATLAAYRDYDVLLVNPILDGMNLVAKEAPLLNHNDGVEVLSIGAGAFDQLQDSVIAVDPLDVEGTGRALHRALTMTRHDRAIGARRLKMLAAANPPSAWLAQALEEARPAARA